MKKALFFPVFSVIVFMSFFTCDVDPPVPTPGPAATATPLITAAPAPTATPAVTAVPSATGTHPGTPAPTASPTTTPTASPTPAPTATPVITPTQTIAYTLAVNISPLNSGSAAKNPDQAQYAAGAQVVLTANPLAGYIFDHWEGALSGNTNPATITMNSHKSVTAVFIKRQWTIMVYMDGDNNLEPNAIDDFNEMESADLAGTGVEIIVLFDRISGFDTTNGGWENTRLYKIRYDQSGNNTTIVSDRIASQELGITATGNEELNMGSAATAVQFINFCKTSYPADRYGFIFWNHGSGWRNGAAGAVQKDSLPPIPLQPGNVLPAIPGISGKPGTSQPQARAVCFDDSNEDYLYTQELHTILAGKNIDVVGFDACLEAMLEVMYEIRNDASYMIASEETTPLDGWDYNLVFNAFKATAKNPVNFINSVTAAFQTSYGSYTGTNISGVDLPAIANVMTAFNAFANTLYNAAATNVIRLNILDALYLYTEDFYSVPGDLNIDLWDCADQISTRWNYADAEAAALKNAIDNAVVAEWHNPAAGETGNPRSYGMAVHLISLNAEAEPDGISSAYHKGASVAYPLSFTADSTWVPTAPDGPGLLYRLWFEDLP